MELKEGLELFGCIYLLLLITGTYIAENFGAVWFGRK